MISSLKPAQLLALLGVVSGVLTTFVKIEALVIGDVSVLPGIFFGAVLAFGLYRWQTQNPLKLLGVVLLVIVAWFAAYMSGLLSYDFFKKTVGLKEVQTFAVLGLMCGFVGSAITAIAIYIFAPAFRVRANWLRVVLFGTVAGLLFALPELALKDFGAASLLPLFVIWQAGIAYLVAGGITGLK